MTDHFDVSTLNWVKGEIDETLKEARIVLEKYAENPEDEAQIHFCAVHLHQVAGTLEMVELRGAAQFASEMEKLADVLPGLSPREPAFEVLMRTLLLLPDYLEVLQSGQPDSPIILLPLLNELRRARGERELTAASVFQPNLEVTPPPAPTTAPADVRELARKLRPHYQAALLNALKGSDVAEGAKVIGAVFDKLRDATTHNALRRWFWVGGALSEALVEGGLVLDAASKLLLSKYEQLIKQLGTSGEDGLNTNAIETLLRATLFEIAKATSTGPRLSEIRAAFRIDALLPPPSVLDKIRTGLGGFNSELKKAVSRDVVEELSRIKDVLDLFGRTQGRSSSELQSIADALTHIADVLGLLRENTFGERLRSQVAQIQRTMRDGGAVDESLLMGVAESVLSVESALSDWGAIAPMEKADDIQGQVAVEDATPEAEAEHRRVVRQVMKEAKDDLVKAREAINAYVQKTGDKAVLAEAPRLLRQIAGSLIMLSYRRVAQVIKACQRFVERDLAGTSAIPSDESLDALADAMMSVEYYLEAFVESRVHPSSVLDVAERAVAKMGYPVDGLEDDVLPLAAPQEGVLEEPGTYEVVELDEGTGQVAAAAEAHANAPAAEPRSSSANAGPVSELDEEIVAIFIEEAEDEFRKIGELLPRWSANPSDEEVLRELRRSFHTLKGSGRLVGATSLGEFAWGFENLLNRVIDQTVTVGSAVFDLLEQARQALPSLLAHFQGGPAPGDEVTALQEMAFAVSKKEAPSAPALATVAPSASTAVEPSITDPVLREIYTKEAETHLTQLGTFVAGCRVSRSRVTDGLVRALHTLCGSSRTAGVPSVAELTATLEKYAKAHQASGAPVEAEAVDLLAETAGFVAGVVAFLRGEQTAAPALGELPRRAEALLAAAESQPKAVSLEDDGLPSAQPDFEIAVPAEGFGEMDEAALASAFEGETANDFPEFHFDLDVNEDGAPLPAAPSAVLDVTPAAQAGLADEHGDHEEIVLALPSVSDLTELSSMAGECFEVFAPSEEEALTLSSLNEGELVAAPVAPVHAASLLLDDAAAEMPFGNAGSVLDSNVVPPALLDGTGAEPARAEEDEFGFSLLADEEASDSSELLGHAATEAIHAASTLVQPLADEPAAMPLWLDEAESETSIQVEDAASPSLLDEEVVSAPSDEEMVAQAPAELGVLAEPVHAESELLEALLREDEQPEAVAPVVAPARETPELLDVFANEAADLLSASDELLQEWVDHPADRRSVEALQRLLHTLKGSARWAGVIPIADLGHALESTFAAVVEGRLPVSEEALHLAQRAQERLEALLSEVRGGEKADGVPELIEKLKALVATASSASAAAQVRRVRDYDPELLSIFLEEGHELLNASDEALQSWMSAPEDKHVVETLQRHLHTLKGGARMAGVPEIGDLGHALESMLAGVADGLVSVSPRMFALLQRSQDRLAVMLEQLRNHDPIPLGDDLIGDIDALISGKEPTPAVSTASAVVAPSVAAVESSETSVSAAPSSESETARADEPEAEMHDSDLARDRRTGSRPQYELVRVRSDLLDSMVNVAGEASIFRSRVEQQIGGFRFNLGELNQVIDRLRERLRMFDIETEAQIQSRFEEAAHQGYEEFDPLEFDRFTHMQQLSRSMVESLGDLSSIGASLHNTTRETETLLVQQARVNTELQEGLMHTRMVQLVQNAPRLRRIVRQTCEELGKEAELRFKGAEVEMDRNVVERIMAPLEHLLRNAVAHGVEPPEVREGKGKPRAGTIVVHQVREGTEVVVRVTDDGGGINVQAVREKAIARGLLSRDAQLSDKEIMLFILESGFSTAESLTQIAGRGVGMDVVNSEVKNLNGSLAIDSDFGKSTTFTIRLPMTLTVSRALLVYAGEDMYAVPLLSIEGIVRASDADVTELLSQEQPLYRWLGQDYDVLHLATTLGVAGAKEPGESHHRSILLAHSGEHRVALVVDGLLGSREIVVKPIGRQLGSLRALSGATILGDGRVALILELPALIRAGLARRRDKSAALAEATTSAANVKPTVMVVDDSITVRKVTSRLLERNDMLSVSAKDGVEAVALLQETVPDVMLLDIEMPRMDGYELATHVRNEPRLRHVPIIMITSRSGEKHRQRAMQIGVNIYMTKPFQESELLENIRSLLPEHHVAKAKAH